MISKQLHHYLPYPYPKNLADAIIDAKTHEESATITYQISNNFDLNFLTEVFILLNEKTILDSSIKKQTLDFIRSACLGSSREVVAYDISSWSRDYINRIN